MKKWIQTVGFLAVALVTALPAHAGEWELVDYKRDADVHNANVVAYNGADDNQPFAVVSKVQRSGVTVQNKPTEQDGGGPITSNPNKDHIGVSWNEPSNGLVPSNDPLPTPGAKKASGSASITVRAVFRWKPKTLFESSIPDPNDKPTPLYIIETASIYGIAGIWEYGNGPVARYSASSPYTGSHFTFSGVKCALQGSKAGIPFTLKSYNASGNEARSEASDFKITLVETNGETEVVGPSQTLSGNIALSKDYANPADLSCHGGAGLFFNYSASVCRFSLDVGADTFASLSDHPRDRKFGAYAGKGLLGRTNLDAATTPYWSGAAGYTTNLSSSLLGTIGTPTYKWESSTRSFHSQQQQNGLDPSLWNGPPGEHELVGTSTSSKQFDHELDDLSHGGSSHTTTKVEITGSNPQKSKLTAKANIDWYRRPYTRYRAEIVAEVYDYQNNRVLTLEEAMRPPAENPYTTEEELAADAFTTEYEAMKTELVATGAQYVGLALEAEMMVGSWFVPDEVDIATAGLTLAGKPLRFLFKSAKTAKVVLTVGNKINRVRDKLSAALPAVKKSLGHDNFIIVIKRKKFREARGGHIGSEGKRVEAEMGELKDEEEVLCKAGSRACFVRGTLVASESGLRAIESIHKGDLVWSRDESSGETKLKRVVQTFEKHAATLKLTFSNGESIETTREHPFYVEGQGFRAAGELGIGTSIVTRAGPAVQLVSSASGEVQPVFNFEVEDFHTYFVGNSQVWVHNKCSDFNYFDPNGKGFGVTSTIDDAGQITFAIKAVDKDGSRASIPGAEMFDRMIRHYGADAKSIKGIWSVGDEFVDNINKVNELTGPPQNMILEEAVKSTWTGRQAINAGFSNVTNIEKVGSPGNYTSVYPTFSKP